LAGRYLSIGFCLIGFGSVLSAFSYFILTNTSLTALGLASIILGATAASLPEQLVPRNAVKAMLRGATLNIEALLEEFEVKGGALYLPPRDGSVSVYLPLASNPKPATIEAIRTAPRRVMTMAEGEPGLMVFPPAAELVRAAELGEDIKLEEALRYLLVDVTELCSTVRASEVEDQIVLEMKNVKIGTEAPRYRALLGTIPSSLAACAIATVTKRGVCLLDETVYADLVKCRFKLE